MFLEIKFIIMVLCSVCMIAKFHPALYENNVIINIENGKIVGEQMEDHYAFRGIPYAEPPIGNLRFAPPQSYSKKWFGLRSFKRFSEVCSQYDHFSYAYEGIENCLTLNVFLPKRALLSDEKIPVIFFIHGGAFMYGGSNIYGPDNIMKSQNMILVTVNYRLGVLGFLSTEDEEISGNFGLKDQAEALRWVQKNIAAFNGDPDKVTITGFSAGGASVHLHYMSPSSEKLFNNGISHSGVAINPWVIMERATEKAHQLAISVNCPQDNHKKLLECLRTKSAEELVMFAKTYQPFLYNPFSPFGVVVEKPHDGAFLTEHPLEILQNGNFKKVPWLLSQTEDEGLYPAAEFYNDDYLKVINDRWLQLAPFILDFNSTSTDEQKKLDTSKRVREYYFQDQEINKESFGILRLMMTDRLYHNGAYHSLQLQSLSASTYFYYFRFPTKTGATVGLRKKPVLGENNFLGISHGDDVFLIYHNPDSRGPSQIPYSRDELAVSRNLINLYYVFSSNNTLKYDDLMFEEVHGENVKGLEIFSRKLYSVDSLEIGHTKFWDDLNINDA